MLQIINKQLRMAAADVQIGMKLCPNHTYVHRPHVSHALICFVCSDLSRLRHLLAGELDGDEKIDYYKLLGLSRNASKTEVKKAYHQKVHRVINSLSFDLSA